MGRVRGRALRRCRAGLGIQRRLGSLPHALIARVNSDRAAAGAEHEGTYLRSLSADAVPALLDRLAEAERCRVVSRLEERWRRAAWRLAHLESEDWRARRLVAPVAGTLACQGAGRGGR